MKVYLAGPMTGLPRWNFDAFDAARDLGISRGHDIVSPADLSREAGFDPDGDQDFSLTELEEAIKRDVAAVLDCDAIALLPGWEKSKGAMAEYRLAVWLNRGILDARTFHAYTELQPTDLHGLSGSINATAIKYGSFIVKDSGQREHFATGAQRDNGDAKGHYHLIPFTAVEREAQLYEAGAKKYGADNWRKGIPLSRFIDSAFRHLFKLAHRWEDEDHAAAVRWNVGCFMETQERIAKGELPADLDDLSGRQG